MIDSFRGQYQWLSNFAPCSIYVGGYTYPSVEHAFQSAKNDEHWWRQYCSTTKSAGLVKRESKKVKLVDNWNTRKVNAMRYLLVEKFKCEPYRQLLLDTGSQYIKEGNTWGDKYWGVCSRTGVGENVLGKMIMEIRETL